MLASDLANKEFVGASNPDARLAVRFYSKPVQNNFETQKQGKPVFRDVDMIRIEIPGDKNSVIDTFARQHHIDRFPLQWARYKNAHGDLQETGTPLSHWQLITAAQAEELKAQKFRTVEAIADASDAQLQSIGMVAGMAPHAFRARAQAWLAAAKDSAIVQVQAEALLKKEQEMAEMKAQMEALRSQVANLTEIALAPEPQKKRRGMPKGGWPKKETV